MGADGGSALDGGQSNDAGEGDGGEGGGCGGSCSTGPKVLALTFAKYPALQNVGGSAVVEASGYMDPACQQDVVIVVHPSSGQYLAFSGSCTHACCTVHFTGSGFACPCHMSQFGLDGTVKSGPAPAPLPKLEVCADACGVYVTLT